MLNELNLTPELLEKAKSATSATALLAFAQENGITLTTEEATTYYSQLHPKEGAISDEELDNVSGGGICDGYQKERLAANYLMATFCNKDPRCRVFETTDMKKKEARLSIPRDHRSICCFCDCKPEFDRHCQSMGWPELPARGIWDLL